MKTLLSMFGYAIVACTFFVVYFISPRWYAIMAIGFVVYALGALFPGIYAGYVRLLMMKVRSFIGRFRRRISVQDTRVSVDLHTGGTIVG